MQVGVLLFPLLPTWGAIGLGLAVLGVWWCRYRAIARSPLNWGLALLGSWLIVTASFAHHPSEAFLGLGNLLPFFFVFAALSLLIQTPAQLRQLAWLLVIPSLPIAILGLGQQFFGWTTPEAWQGVLGWVLEAGGNPPGRMASVFIYANLLAAYLQMTVILELGLGIERFWAWRRERERYCTIQLSFLGITLVSSAIALVLTNSRNGWGVAGFACLAFALYLGWRWLVVGVAAFATAILGAAFGPSPLQDGLRGIVPVYFWGRLTDRFYADRPVALMRTTQWQFTLSLTGERPWLGWGLRNFTPLYEQQTNLWLGHPHNLFLMLLAETGIPATLLFCSLVGWILARGGLLLRDWSAIVPETPKHHWRQDRLIFFAYLTAFGGLILFNLADVTLFDFRVNTLGWLLLSAIWGVASRD
jgi:O-antigen ligase